jgi:hypothetical protein
LVYLKEYINEAARSHERPKLGHMLSSGRRLSNFCLITICPLSGRPKPSSAASPHTPQPAVLFVDSEFASVSTYNVQGPCGADQTTIPWSPVTPSGAWTTKHQTPYNKHQQNAQRQYSYCPDTPLYRFCSSVSTVTRLQTGHPKNRGVRIPEEIFLFSKTSRPSLGPIQPHIQPGFFTG